MQHRNPIFVVGAPRSGKKMTSEVIGRAAGVHAFPYEINCLWRTGHRDYPFDTLSPEMMSPTIRNRIQAAFNAEASLSGCSRIVDRTDHNIVRLEYVRAAFPDCRIIHVVRDARGSIASAIKRRRKAIRLRYFVDKAAYVPRADLFYYGVRYALDIAQARCGKHRYRNYWGIRTPVAKQFASHPSLPVKCAVQWSESIRYALDACAAFSHENYLMVRYEDLVNNPQFECQRIFDFVDLPWEQSIENWIDNNLSSASLTLWKQDLSGEQLEEIYPHVSDLMAKLKYSWSEPSAAEQSKTAFPIKFPHTVPDQAA